MAVEKKYELTDETIEFAGKTLHRIRALRSFGKVKAGDVGGFVESEGNLSHEGDCWGGNRAWVYGDARVFGNAKVLGFSHVYDNARVYENANVLLAAAIYGNAKVCGNAHVFGNAKVCDEAAVFGNAYVYDNIHVYGSAKVYGNAKVCGYAKVCDAAKVFGHAVVYGKAKIYGNAYVCGTEEYGGDRVYMCSHNANEAHKNDDGKPRVELIPPLALLEIGKVLEFGAKKYGANNWRNGMHWSRLHGAALRHLLAWFGGEHKDAESDLSHLAHAACCILFLMECEAQQIGHDDRPHKN